MLRNGTFSRQFGAWVGRSPAQICSMVQSMVDEVEPKVGKVDPACVVTGACKAVQAMRSLGRNVSLCVLAIKFSVLHRDILKTGTAHEHVKSLLFAEQIRDVRTEVDIPTGNSPVLPRNYVFPNHGSASAAQISQLSGIVHVQAPGGWSHRCLGPVLLHSIPLAKA